MEKCDAVIIGAGPYGMSVAAHLRQVKGLDLRVFGEPMSFWERHMPEGMLLRSPRVASHLSDPRKLYSLDAFEKATGRPEPNAVPPMVAEDFIVRDMGRKIPLFQFIKYGHWFCQQAGVAPDHRKVVQIEAASGGYRIAIDDGTVLQAQSAVVAGGTQPFAYKPEIFATLPAPFVMHTSEFRNFDRLRDKEILVVGGGQSALESAALLYETGARVEVSVHHHVRWFGLRHLWSRKRPVSLVLYGRGDVGPMGLSVLVQHPALFRHLPRRWQDEFGIRAIRPGASNWVMARTRHVPIHENQSVLRTSMEGEKVRIQFGDRKVRLFDRVILGTGYRVNVAQYRLLSQKLLESIAMVNGYPCLNSGFETTSPGLYFVGAPAAWSFGPLMRFVDGTEFTSGVLARRFARPTRRDWVGSPIRSPRRVRKSAPLGLE